MATPSAKKDHAEIAKQRAHKETRLRDEATQLAAQIVTKEIRIGAKTSTTGKIFGSVNSIQIAEALSKKGFEIDRKNITLVDADNIKQIGTFKAIVKLYKDIKAEIDFEVFAE